MSVDLVVIGGGINGLAIARDAAVRGLRVTLVERDDVGCETSNWSSRMIHGGLRYLERLDLRLVRESLREREVLFRTAPHLVRPMRILIPVYRESTRSWSTIRAGMVLYDLLSYGKSVASHEVLRRDQVIEMMPGLRRTGLLGAVAYTDGQVEFSERLCVELALDAERHGADLRTKTTVTGIDVTTDESAVVCVESGEGTDYSIHARCVVNATGPWVDRLIPDAASRSERLVGGTKGSHIVLPRFPGAPTSTVHFETDTGKPLLCIPMQAKLLVGSTDELFRGDPGAARISSAELDLLVSEVNRLFPAARIGHQDVLYTYAGVRPLPYAPGQAATAITRRHRIHRHAPAPNLFSVIGGKLTTHRQLAQEAVDLVARQLGRKVPRSTTARLPLPGAATVDELAGFRRALTKLALDDQVAARIVDVYGALSGRVVDLVTEDPRLGEEVLAGSSVVAAEVLIAVDKEHARSLTDVVFRRLAAAFHPQRDALVAEAGRILAAERGWSPAKIQADVQEAARLSERMAGGSGPVTAAS